GISATLRAMWDEASNRRLGYQTAVVRLTDLLFVEMVRAVASNKSRLPPGWLSALGDERIALAIAAMHDAPARPSTGDTLAEAAQMSRSPFACRFAALVGSTPLAYLTQVRIQRAMTLLREGREVLAKIATEVGYGSATALSKAFRRFTGTSPRAFAT